MEFRYLGRSGLKISAITYGNWLTHGSQVENDVAAQCVRAALDAGISSFDTADVYANGAAESVLGEILKGERRESLEIFTKVYWPTGPKGHNDVGLSRKHIAESIDASLRRLRTDYVDLFQMHAPDPQTPIAETLSALDELVHEGKVRYIGCSNFAGWQVADAAWTAETKGLEPFVSAQNRYSLLDRSVEDELVPACERFGLGMLPFFPLEYGLLTGKYRRGEAAPTGSRADLDAGRAGWLAAADWDRIEALEAYAAERGLSVLDVAIAGLAAQPTVASVISGVSRGEQVRTNAAALRWEPTEDDLHDLATELAKSR